MKATEIFNRKKFVRMFMVEEGCPDLKLSDLMVGCYRSFQDVYDEVPSLRKVVLATGLRHETVRYADKRLKDCGWLNCDSSVNIPPERWFRLVRKPLPGHWHYKFAYWDCYIRNPATSRINHIQVAMLSILWHFLEKNYTPPDGFTIAYFAQALRCKWHTARDALDTLQSQGWLNYQRRDDCITVTLNTPTPEMLACLQDKKPAPESAPCIGYSGKTAEEQEPIPPTKEELLEVLGVAYPLDLAEQKAEEIMQVDGYEELDREFVLARMRRTMATFATTYTKEQAV